MEKQTQWRRRCCSQLKQLGTLGFFAKACPNGVFSVPNQRLRIGPEIRKVNLSIHSQFSLVWCALPDLSFLSLSTKILISHGHDYCRW